ncbi:hypothetical protein [Rhodococcus koreensis]|uniref:hypothetical protein n=1 Tax=Rhodococcus koreensis TaxID=99653 RepID=UPI0036D98997
MEDAPDHFNTFCPNWMVKIPLEIAAFLGVLLCLPTAFISIASGRDRLVLCLFVGVCLIFILAVTATHIHYDRWKKKREQSAADASRRELETFLAGLAVPLSQELATVVSTTGKVDRKFDLAGLRRGIIEATASAVGQRIDVGTRAHVFEFKQDGIGRTVLTPSKYVAGTGNPSLRTLSEGHETYEMTLIGERRFVPDTHKLVTNDGKRPKYRTYMTYPIEGAANEFYGVLTVDCPDVGDLDEEQDGLVMQYLAALFAATYAAEGVASVRGKRDGNHASEVSSTVG